MTPREMINTTREAYPQAGQVHVYYEGSGDNGGIASVTFYNIDGQEMLEATMLVLLEEFEEKASNIIDAHYGGWYNEDGGFGTVIFDLIAGTAQITHSWYESSTSTDNPMEFANFGVGEDEDEDEENPDPALPDPAPPAVVVVTSEMINTMDQTALIAELVRRADLATNHAFPSRTILERMVRAIAELVAISGARNQLLLGPIGPTMVLPPPPLPPPRLVSSADIASYASGVNRAGGIPISYLDDALARRALESAPPMPTDKAAEARVLPPLSVETRRPVRQIIPREMVTDEGE